MRYTLYFLVLLFAQIGCSTKSKQPETKEKANSNIEKISNGSIVCFVYHRFGDNKYPSTNISIADFEAHLGYLKEENFQVITFEKAMQLLKSGQLPEQRTAVLTIDDGYESFYSHGLPLLETYGYPATLFINTETVGGSSYMSWEQLADAKQRGIEIGNHTHSHAYFLNLSSTDRYDVFTSELKTSQQLIEENLGEKPSTFAYPYGELDEQMKSIVKDQGFIGAAAQNSGVICEVTDRWKCPRFPMSENYSSSEKFISKSNMKPISVVSQTPLSFINAEGESTPTLELVIKNENLLLSNANVFIQGGKGTIKMEDQDDNTSKVIIKATSPIDSRRRTLYTLTVQDSDGEWHWFSHLWINSSVK